jgi:hypothetical protein
VQGVHANLRSPTRYLFSSDMSQWKIPDRKLYFYNA